jgi:hypothetical protein
MKIYLRTNGKEEGPFDDAQLKNAVEHDGLSVATPAREESASGWIPLGDLLKIPAPKTTVATAPAANNNAGAEPSFNEVPVSKTNAAQSPKTGVLLHVLIGAIIILMSAELGFSVWTNLKTQKWEEALLALSSKTNRLRAESSALSSKSSAPASQWEYKLLSVDGPSIEIQESQLRMLGLSGWEIVTCWTELKPDYQWVTQNHTRYGKVDRYRENEFEEKISATKTGKLVIIAKRPKG